MQTHNMETGTVTYSADDQKSIDLVKQYMQIVYDPNGRMLKLSHNLCAPNNRFIAPTIMGDEQTPTYSFSQLGV